MNDLDLVRELRADSPELTPEQLAAGRERLLELIARESVRGGPRRARSRPARRHARVRLTRPPLALAGALLAVAAVIAAVSLRHGSAHPPPRVTTPVRLASEVLHRAAVVRGSELPAEPRPDQWIYQYGVEQSVGQPTQRTASWERFDGRETAWVVDGRLVLYDEKVADTQPSDPLEAYLADPTPRATYEALAALPADPHALLAQVDAVLRSGAYDANGLPLLDVVPTNTRAQRVFQFIAQLLWQDTQSGLASGAANVFTALSTLPGVTAQDGLTDALGRPAVALSDDGGRFQLLLSPASYQVLGIRSVSTGDAPHLPNGATTPKGTVVQSFAIADTLVAAPGRRQ